MIGPGLLIAAAAMFGVAGVVALRLAWAKPRRSTAANSVAWGILLLSLLLAVGTHGAWGVAVVTLVILTAAFAALAAAAIGSPAGGVKASSRGVGMLPPPGQPLELSRRLGTFALCVLWGFAIAIGLAMAIMQLGGWLGWSVANTNVIALFSVPLTWSLLVFAILIQQRRRTQFSILLAASLPTLPALLSGLAT